MGLTVARMLTMAAYLLAPALPASASAALLQQGLPLSSGDPGVEMGHSAALSDDGNTALLGGPTNGHAWIFTRTGATWTRQVDLTPDPNRPRYSEYGTDVALSADGTIAVVGSPAEDAFGGTTMNGPGGPGAAFVFTRAADGGWTLQSKIGSGAQCCGGPHFGAAVAISGDGATIAVGAPYQANSGAAYIYRRDGSAWTQTEMFMLGNAYGTAGHIGDGIGGDAALNGDGTVAMVGSNHGAYVLARNPDGSWTQQPGTPKPADPSGAYADVFGSPVELSTDGRSALVGGYGGPRWFTRPDPTSDAWTQLGPQLTPFGPAPGPLGPVALSRDGTTALAGALGSKNEDQGTGWTFTRTPEGYTNGTRLAASDDTIFVGESVALSGDGTTALLGGRQSKAFAFAHIPTVATISPAVGSVLGGTRVVVTGDDLTGATGVRFGDVAAAGFHVDGPNRLSAVAPAGGPGRVDVTVTGPMGTSPIADADRYTYVWAAVKVAAGAATIGRRGPALRLSCTAADCAGAVQLVSIVPTRAGTHHVTVVAGTTYRLAVGASATVRLRMTGAGRRLISRAHGRVLHLTARATVAGGWPAAQRISVRPARPA